ncbi:MAG: precorrin-6A reductase [Mobilitalea sp.]
MKQVLIFAGTTEGRSFAEFLCRNKISCTVCVATEYGEQVMESKPGLTIHTGRMNAEEMKQFITAGNYLAVVDATHPFATAVSENIKKSMEKVPVPYLRLKRNTKYELDEQKDVSYFSDSEACASALAATQGNILLTTGSKDLAAFSSKKELFARLFVRVLPGLESISLCYDNGFTGKQILALQGPFSVEMNEAMIRQYNISYLVTKESGSIGGFLEKIQAAKNTGIKTMVIGNPEKAEGYTFRGVCMEIEKLTGKKLELYERMQISLIGIGMGSQGLLTREAEQLINDAEVIFGASRLLEGVLSQAVKLPYYQAVDILPFLKKKDWEQQDYPKEKKIVILFSGDTGFYSGADKMYEALSREIATGDLEADIRIYPGISSISYLAAKLGISWQDAAIISIHGRKGNVLETVKRNKKTFLLTSGLEDIKNVGSILVNAGLTEVKLHIGYQLTYPEERILTMKPEECLTLEAEGLYACFVEHMGMEKDYLTHGLPDEAFIRGKVPMTKEEVRDISICKLGLHQEAILYDIGSGTGSIAIECARLSDRVQVYAIEKKQEAVELIEKNRTRFDLNNISLVEGEAPEALKVLPIPTHAFIGGSSGNLKGILELLYQKNPALRVVINAITLETLQEVMNLTEAFNAEKLEVVQVQVNRAHAIGRYHMMQAENPVYILSFNFKSRETGMYSEVSKSNLV